MKLSDIAKINYVDPEVIYDCEVDCLGMATSTYKNKKVLVFLEDNKYLNAILNNSSIVAIICDKETYEKTNIDHRYGVLLSDKPKKTFFKIHNKLAEKEFYWRRFENNISKMSDISSKAIIGDNSIEIGQNCTIEQGVVIHSGTIIGNNVIIRSGSQIGTSAFQFVKEKESILSVKTAGRLIVEDNVEIQHNACIDRGVMGGDTIIKKDVKIDNLVHIAHDSIIGERTLITSGTNIAGRVTIGKDCWLGVNSTISNGIIVGDNCRVSLGSVVVKDVESNSTVTGNFAIEHKRFLRNLIKSSK